MVYALLVLAILAEVLGTSLLPRTDGFTRPLWTIACLAAYAVAFLLLAQIVKELPVGIAYAVWAGLGTAAIVLVGTVFLDQPLNAATLVGIGLIIVGVVIVNLAGSPH